MSMQQHNSQLSDGAKLVNKYVPLWAIGIVVFCCCCCCWIYCGIKFKFYLEDEQERREFERLHSRAARLKVLNDKLERKKHQSTDKIIEWRKVNNKNDILYGERVMVIRGKKPYEGVIQFIGKVRNVKGIYVGVTLDSPDGDINGFYENMRYFSCPENRGVMVKLTPNVLQKAIYESHYESDEEQDMGSKVVPSVDKVTEKQMSLQEKEKETPPAASSSPLKISSCRIQPVGQQKEQCQGGGILDVV